MDVFKHTSIPLSKRNGRAYVSYQMLAYRRDCTVLLKQYFFKGSVARGSKSAERERGREREIDTPDGKSYRARWRGNNDKVKGSGNFDVISTRRL